MTPPGVTVVAPFRIFLVEVALARRLSPTFVRVTLRSDDLKLFADNGFDQRVKLLLPLADSGLAHVPTGVDWYARWRELPEQQRNPIRTYTARAVRPDLGEIDIDLALHGVGGPASRWALSARPGDVVAVLGPDANFDGVHGGIEFHPPSPRCRLLLAGDETAVPAISAILERLPVDACGEVLLEVPERGDDALDLDAPAGIRVGWLAREGATHGQLLVPAVEAALDRLEMFADVKQRDSAGLPLADVDIDHDILWEVPDVPAAPPEVPGLYAWLAGEAGVVRELRRLLVQGRGVDRRLVAFMGYWRLGRAEDSG